MYACLADACPVLQPLMGHKNDNSFLFTAEKDDTREKVSKTLQGYEKDTALNVLHKPSSGPRPHTHDKKKDTWEGWSGSTVQGEGRLEPRGVAEGSGVASLSRLEPSG